MDEPTLMQSGTSGLRGNASNDQLWGQKVKGQGHTRPKIDLDTWRRHRFRPFLGRLCLVGL